MVELAEIFQRYGPAYREKYGEHMPWCQRQAMQAIEQCRTEILGGQVYHCDRCDEPLYSYHSCKNRHCPKCQNDSANHWLAQQQTLLLPVPHFMVTFTLPESLRAVARRHQKLIYNLLFRTSAAALQELALDQRFVGGQIGMLGVLHTWGRNLVYHPHVHYLVPGGGLVADGQTWLPSRHNILVHVKPLSTLFRAKFRDALKKTDLFDLVPAEVWTQPWIVHSKPVGTGHNVLKYLTPYIFRVAISNNRLLKVDNDRIIFRYKDTVTGKTKCCSLAAEEFIRRFLQHVLPKGFVKVRYYGLFAPGQRARLNQARQLLGEAKPPPLLDVFKSDTSLPNPTIRCPKCHQTMRLIETIRPQPRQPP